MLDLIRRALRWTRLLFSPGTGRRRRTRHHACLCVHITAVRLPRHRSPYGLVTPLDGADSALVRPYLAAHEREAALRQGHRPGLVRAEVAA
ncbi:hypothetical protein ACLVWQ_32490 (plasmid) [Streptomyces sp. CWNU-52B]|uniref:hypothetical protein n=1 Tax=unclassified Streptomyces TaxID=2593676 RepID=UPI0039C341C3